MSDSDLLLPTSTGSQLVSQVTGTSNGNGKFMMDVAQGGATSSLNSSTTPLTNGSTFTGTGEQNDFPQVGVMLKTDQDGVLYFDFSNDGTNWDSTFPVAGFQVSGGISEFHTAVKLGRYFRVRLTNDSGSDQTYLRLKTYYGQGLVPSVAPLNQSLATDHDAISTRTDDFSDEVTIGRRLGVTPFTKFGYRTGLTAAAGEETVWATTGNFTPMTSASTFTIAYDNTADGSTANGAKTLFFQYIDANGLQAESVHTLGSSGSDVTSFTGLGINRISVSSSGSTQYNGANITVTETTGGTTQGFLPIGESVTQQAIYFVDSNSYAVAKFLWIKANRSSGGGNPKILVKGYVFNRNVATRFQIFRATIDTQSETIINIVEPVNFRLTPTDVLYFVADTDTNNSEIQIRFSLREYKID